MRILEKLKQRETKIMKLQLLKKQVGYSNLLAVMITLIIAGCAPKVNLQVVKPAEVDTQNIKKVAIGHFEIAEVSRTFKVERNGDWQIKKVMLTDGQKVALSNQVRARVINLLSTTPYFNLEFTDEFQKMDNDTALQKAIAAGGYRTSKIDAVINGKIWLNVVNVDATELSKVELEYVRGGRQGSFNYTLETLVYWPYKSISGTLALEMKLTRLNPTEVVAVTFDTRKVSQKIGGKPGGIQDQIFSGAQQFSNTVANLQDSQDKTEEIEQSDLVLPNFEQITADMAESIAAQFVRRVAVTQKTVSYTIATGGDDTARLLIEAGAYEKAIERLNDIIDRAEDKNPDDIYNLGLCYESTGDFGIAMVTYQDAIKLDDENLIYAQGIGRIEKVSRENLRIRTQILGKK